MLLRLITIISLINFLLLMIAGMSTETALYRSVLIFMVLFGVVYLTIFFLNVIRENPQSTRPASDAKKKQNEVSH
ncbi:MAG: hypothetical protein EA360_06620 [Balneolaceae bacterium]|nr:MAG: hypothetical protein EA360_06620 [Balneolaceae bacterium]